MPGRFLANSYCVALLELALGSRDAGELGGTVFNTLLCVRFVAEHLWS